MSQTFRPPETWNDKRIEEISRRVFGKAMTELDRLMNEASFAPERMDTYASIAAAAANGFSPQDAGNDFD